MKFLISSVLLLIISGLLFMSCNNTENPIVIPGKVITDNPGATWYVPGDFSTIQDAIYSPNVSNGDIIIVGPGNFYGAYVNKGVEIRGTENTVINDGPVHGSGMIMGFRLLAGSDNAKFNHLTFTVDLDIMSGATLNNVTVSHCVFLNAVQAISAWRGSGWNITHNTITNLRCCNGGGIGILLGDYTGGTISGNIVSHNEITGTLSMCESELGGYAGSGIVIYADFRWGALGAAEILNNYITNNKVSLVSGNPSLVDVVALELTDTRNIPDLNIMHDNAIGFNDLRGTNIQIALTPESLDNPINDISRNFGDTRGHGLPPSDFKP